MSLKILQGGVVRYPFDATISGTESVWNAGQICEVDPTTQALIAGTGGTVGSGSFRVSGLVIEEQSAITDQVAASGKASLILSEAVVQSDQLAASISFVIGDLVYGDTSGLLTTAATVSKVFGQALSTAVQTNGDTLTMLYSVQLS